MMLRMMIPLLLATPLGAGTAAADDPIFPFGKKPVQSGVLPTKTHAAHFLADSDDYTEYWNHAFLFKSGHVLFARYLVTNLGPGDNKGAVLAHLVTPSGEVHEFLDGRRDRSWSYSSETLDYKLAGHALSGDGREFRLQVKNDAGAEVRLAFTNTIDSYRPGRILYGHDKQAFFDLTVTSPRASARGTFTAGGRTVELDGTGYADHFYTNYAQHNQVSSYIAFQGFTDDITVNLTTMLTTKKFGKRRVPFLALGRGGQIAFTSNAVNLSQSKFWTDGKSKAKYRVPGLFRFSSKDKKSGDWVRGRVVVKKRLHRYDVLQGLASFERFVVERIAQPYQYRFLVEFTLEGEVGGQKVNARGDGLAEVIHINR